MADPSFIRSVKLKLEHSKIISNLYNDEGDINLEALHTIPSLASIYKLPTFSKTRETAAGAVEDLFETHKEMFEYGEHVLNLLVYNNISSALVIENR